MKKMNLLFYYADTTAHAAYRCFLVVKNLLKQGLVNEVRYNCIMNNDDIEWADVIILQRQYDKDIFEVMLYM